MSSTYRQMIYQALAEGKLIEQQVGDSTRWAPFKEGVDTLDFSSNNYRVVPTLIKIFFNAGFMLNNGCRDWKESHTHCLQYRDGVLVNIVTLALECK